MGELIESAEQLSKISKRLEELKQTLEAGQLKADEVADSAVEYKILKIAYKQLLYGEMVNFLKMEAPSVTPQTTGENEKKNDN